MSPAPHRPTADPQEIIADLQRELAVCRAELDQRTAELSDALEQQTAAAEVLGVSPRTADLIWAYSKAWLLQKIWGDGPASPREDGEQPSNS